MKNQSVLVIGSGLGALATALRLSSRGFDVHIVEKFHQAGGRLNRLDQDGFSFDMGPSFFSMSYEFDELFRDAGVENPLSLQPLDPLYAVYFRNRKEPYLISKNLNQLAETFKNVEPDFRSKAEKYLQRAEKVFYDTEYRVVKKNFNSRLHYLASLSRVPLKHAPGMFTSLWSLLGNYFDSEEVKIIFSLVAFFLGSTPFDTPAVYSLLNYVEMKHDGYWNVKGGMYSIVEELLALLKKNNVRFHFQTEIESVQTNENGIQHFTDQNGKSWSADLYVVNADAASFRQKVLKRKKFSLQKLDHMQWTLAPFTVYLGVKGKIEKLHQHNYFLGDHFKEYAQKIFRQAAAPEQPYYYLNVSSKSNPECAPTNCENLFILCPVPHLQFKPDWSDAEILRRRIIADLSSRIGFDIESNIISSTVMTPVDWQNTFNLYHGSGLGLAHGMKQIGAFRPSNVDECFKNLFYAGSSTVPGTGLPMVVISSKLVTERILNYVRTV